MDRNQRFKGLCAFYTSIGGVKIPELICGDASNRKFYRVPEGILMDAPNETEKNPEFVDIAARLNKVGVNAPVILQNDMVNGYLLVSDLGSKSFSDLLGQAKQTEQLWNLYTQAIDVMIKLVDIDTNGLPIYDQAFIKREDDICREYYFTACDRPLMADEELIVEAAEEIWTKSDLGCPQIAVHRDFHCRNIMSTTDGLALVDFQDMVRGPLVYDLASLLKDCYYELPRDLLERLLDYAFISYDRVLLHGTMSKKDFLRAFDLAGLQRHFKCLGIFNRLSKRDGKHGYLANIPLVEKYVINTSSAYHEFKDLEDLINKYARSFK